jgi:hypothetical protein
MIWHPGVRRPCHAPRSLGSCGLLRDKIPRSIDGKWLSGSGKWSEMASGENPNFRAAEFSWRTPQSDFAFMSGDHLSLLKSQPEGRWTVRTASVQRFGDRQRWQDG